MIEIENKIHEVNLPIELTPKLCSDNSLFGEYRDGGYYLPISIVKNSDQLFGGGVATSWHFERQVKKVNGDIKIFLFDGSISVSHFFLNMFRTMKLLHLKVFLNFVYEFYVLKRYTFASLWIRRCNDKNSTNLENFLSLKKSIIKLDIEGGEYELLPSIKRSCENLNAIIIEFHDFYENQNIIVDFALSLTDTHVISYLNVNNYSGLQNLPLAIEIIWIKKEFFVTDRHLFVPNNPQNPPIHVTYN